MIIYCLFWGLNNLSTNAYHNRSRITRDPRIIGWYPTPIRTCNVGFACFFPSFTRMLLSLERGVEGGRKEGICICSFLFLIKKTLSLWYNIIISLKKNPHSYPKISNLLFSSFLFFPPSYQIHHCSVEWCYSPSPFLGLGEGKGDGMIWLSRAIDSAISPRSMIRPQEDFEKRVVGRKRGGRRCQ